MPRITIYLTESRLSQLQKYAQSRGLNISRALGSWVDQHAEVDFSSVDQPDTVEYGGLEVAPLDCGLFPPMAFDALRKKSQLCCEIASLMLSDERAALELAIEDQALALMPASIASLKEAYRQLKRKESS